MHGGVHCSAGDEGKADDAVRGVLAVTGGRVVCESGVRIADVIIEGEVIAEIAEGGTARARADEEIDARGLLVFPGAIDPHVHFGDLGQAHREDFETGTAAASLAGVTTVFEHPLSEPPTTTAARYREKLRTALGRAHVDIGLWGAITPEGLGEIQGQWDEGARGFKAFLCDSLGSYPHVDDDELLNGMREVAKLGGLVLVHAENNAIVNGATRRVRASGRRDPVAHADARPAIAEIEATARALLLARAADVRVQIVHVSHPDAVALVDAAAATGVRSTLEHTAHHLLLDTAALRAAGPWARCSPPLRARDEVERLWTRIQAGGAAQLASDHSPYTHAEKLVGTDDIFAAGMGIQSVQEAVPLFLDEAVYRRDLKLERCADIIATECARTLGLYPQKGAIRVGAHADLALWDPDAPWVVRADQRQRSRNPWSPFDGRRCRMRLVRTILRGNTIAVNGEVVGAPGSGRPVVAGLSAQQDPDSYLLGSEAEESLERVTSD